LVLNVDNSGMSPGTVVYPFPRNEGLNQQWYDDQATGTIRSRLNGYSMDIEGDRLVINPYKEGKVDQQWERSGTLIVNRGTKNMVLDIAGSIKDEKTKVIKFKATGNPNQSWTFELV